MVNGTIPASFPEASWRPKPKDSAAKIEDAAVQFESLLIDQMLKSSHSADEGGWMGSPEDQNSTLLDMGQQQFAQTLAHNGGFGIAKMIVAGLHQNENRSHQPPAAATKD
jgi:Rod binding domain-containing protein